ncbi:MAG: DNA recombination protein RmuC [Clostridia bacterium]|nr:DNA recombination protein RmuC [Clostridia bacterium]
MPQYDIYICIGALIFSLASAVISLIALIGLKKQKPPEFDDRRIISDLGRLGGNVETLSTSLTKAQDRLAQTSGKALDDMSKALGERVADMEGSMSRAQKVLAQTNADSIKNMNETLTEKLAGMEKTLASLTTQVGERLKELSEGNEKRLGEIQKTVDDKLQKTLDEKISRSFADVSTRLEQVHKSLGEMNSLTKDVGDLKNVLSNVKTRGILGEIQLGAILGEILSPEQYETNVVTVSGTSNPVEYAVKLPGAEDGKSVWLPIDSKFPLDCYRELEDAYESADQTKIAYAGKQLEQRLKQFAKTIHDLYVRVPETTDFAIMFLPTEGLYAEAVRRGMVETLQNSYKINIAGPTTMAALLNSLQMGFRTLAIQKRSGEVWEVLGAVKTEFEKFEDALSSAQNRINQANNDLDKLVGTRTRAINRKLKSVSALPSEKATELLEDGNE